MTIPPDISVVVPTRDQAARLDATLHAFARQDAPPGSWELVVVDDGSTDTTADVLRAAGERLPLRAEHTPARGRAAARNTGTRISRGAVVVFCDGDRAPVPGFVRAHARAHDGGRDRVVVGDVKEMYVSSFEERLFEVKQQLATDGEALRRRSRTPAFVKKVCAVYDETGRTTSPVRWLSFLSGNVSLRRELFDRAGGFDEDFTRWGLEHLELGHRLVTLGAEFRHCAAARNDHFAHGRPAGFYREALERSAAHFERKHPGVPAELLLGLTLDGMSVTEFEESLRASARPTRRRERSACDRG
ncbi:glycosyltransferase [Streptomyces sp. NPDC004629]|uniref:glycosyltransferase n=1 Tax=Streptomyces sp. NPDC004629 TaxID=3364705 RepID=UPI0036783194